MEERGVLGWQYVYLSGPSESAPNLKMSMRQGLTGRGSISQHRPRRATHGRILGFGPSTPLRPCRLTAQRGRNGGVCRYSGLVCWFQLAGAAAWCFGNGPPAATAQHGKVPLQPGRKQCGVLSRSRLTPDTDSSSRPTDRAGPGTCDLFCAGCQFLGREDSKRLAPGR
jgi:hypothetical protein